MPVVCGVGASRAPTRMRSAARERHRFIATAQGLSRRHAPSHSTCRASRLAVHRVTGEVRILHSDAADIGRLINPMQCRGQIDGAIGMAIGWAL